MHQSQLLVKVVLTYAILLLGIYLRKHFAESQNVTQRVQNAAVGFLWPTAALLLTYNSPIIGLRFLYYSHAVAFVYLASIIAAHEKELAIRVTALGVCCLGLVTWTYPTVSQLLVW